MTELQKQVRRAQRRINMQHFLGASVWCLAICLGAAVLALGVIKIWPIGVPPRQWTMGWLGGAVGVGFLAAGIWTWARRRGMVDAAIEIDRRFGLKERVSSSLSLSPEEVRTDIGQALVDDASKRLSRIDVREQFAVRTNRWAWLPLLTGALAIALVFLPDATPSATNEAQATPVEVRNQVKKSAAELQRKLANQSKDLDEKGLKEASKLVKELQKGVNELAKNGAKDRKQAMVKMNDLTKAIKLRRDSLQGGADLKKQLHQLKDLKTKHGPADKLAKALKNGDFQAALDQVKDLQRQLRQGSLTKEQQQQLAEQMQQMRKKLSDLVAAHEKAKEELKKQIAEKKKQGDHAAARKMQQQLERLQAQDEQMKRVRRMANKMNQMAQAMKQGNQQDAAQQLTELAQDLQAMQTELDELQALDDALDQMANARDAMNCEACDGAGCAQCQGFGFDQQGMAGFGMSDGQGRGDRPEERTDANFYDSKVRAEPRRGKMVIVGSVRGENKPGDAREAIKEAMEAASSAEENPLTNLRLPRVQREQAQQYFDAVREGQ